MTDLEMTRLCAEARNYEPIESWLSKRDVMMTIEAANKHKAAWHCKREHFYAPLTDDAQAMALLLWLLSSGTKIVIENNDHGTAPILIMDNTVHSIDTVELLRRAIVNCVATIQQAKHG